MNDEKIKVDCSKIYFKPINSDNEEYKELTCCGLEINNITVTEPLCNEKFVQEYRKILKELKNKQYEFNTTFIIIDIALIKVKQVKTKRLKKKYYKKTIYYNLTHEKRW